MILHEKCRKTVYQTPQFINFELKLYSGLVWKGWHYFYCQQLAELWIVLRYAPWTEHVSKTMIINVPYYVKTLSRLFWIDTIQNQVQGLWTIQIILLYHFLCCLGFIKWLFRKWIFVFFVIECKKNEYLLNCFCIFKNLFTLHYVDRVPVI